MGPDGLFPLTLAVSVLTGGVAVTYASDARAPIVWRLAAGWCIGLGAFGLAGLVLGSWRGLSATTALLAAAVALSPIALLWLPASRDALRHDVYTAVARVRGAVGLRRAATPERIAEWARAIVYALGLVVLWRVASRVMIVRSEGIFTGVSHNLGDLPFHLSVINRLLAGGAIPPEHPSFAGAAFTYPFLTDLVAALFVAAGAPTDQVFVWSTWSVTVAFAVLVHRWTLTMTGRRDAAFLAPILTLASGGLGWWRFVVEAASQDSGAWSALRLTHDYSITTDNAFRWGNVVTTLLLPQRGLLLGLPLAVFVFQQWWQVRTGTDERESTRRRRLWVAGSVAALLPLVHAHTYAVVLGIGACQVARARDYRVWWPFFAVALAAGLPQIWSVSRGSEVEVRSLLAWSVGWDHGDQPIVWFWLMNTGLLIPLILLALVWRHGAAPVPAPLVRFYLPFLLCFAIPNLLRLAPWIWDNVKVLVYWFVASVPVVALLLVRLAHGAWWRRAAVSAVVVSLTLAGALDLWRVATHGIDMRILDRDGMVFADHVRAATAADALVLHAPTYAHPIVLTGRQSFMGYPGHIWSHGLDPVPREADVRAIYAGGHQSAALLERHGIDYVVIGPLERRLMTVDDGFFERFTAVVESPGYRLYRVAHD